MIFYKHYIGDFQRDTGHLSLTERGAYLALMHHYYATEQPLPNDLSALCRIAGAVEKHERAAVKAVTAFFEPVESGLMHKRIEAELHRSSEISDTNRAIALAREGKRRAEKQARIEHEQSTLRADDVPRTEHEQSTSHSHNHKKKNQSQKLSAAFAAPEWIPAELWDVFLKARTKKRASNDPVALGLIVGQLESFRGRGHDPTAIIGNSLRGGYADVFEPKANAPNGYESAKDRSRRETIEELTGKKRSNDDRVIDITPRTVAVG